MRTIPICHHIQDCAELGCLAEGSRRLAVDCVQQTRYAVQQRAVLWVIAHVVESEPCEDDAAVAWIALEQRENGLTSKGSTDQSGWARREICFLSRIAEWPDQRHTLSRQPRRNRLCDDGMGFW
jgi:hypothetical protein